MILTCPSCEARFNVDPEALLPNGRTVRCGKCGHTWKEMPPEDMPKRVEEIEPPAPVVPEPDDIDSHPEYGNVGDDAIRNGDDHTGVPGIEGDGNEASERGRFRTLRLTRLGRAAGAGNAGPEASGRWSHGARSSASSRSSSGAASSPAMRSSIRGRRRRCSMGWSVLPPNPVSGSNSSTKAPILARDGDMAVLVIKGEIVNTSSRPRIVPTLQGSLQDADQNEIHSWTFSAVPEELAPGESGTFNTRVPNPPEGVRRAPVTFVEGKGGLRAWTGRPTPDATSGKSSK